VNAEFGFEVVDLGGRPMLPKLPPGAVGAPYIGGADERFVGGMVGDGRVIP